MRKWKCRKDKKMNEIKRKNRVIERVWERKSIKIKMLK